MLKKLETEVSNLKPKVTSHLWAVIQSVALVFAIVSPVLFKIDSKVGSIKGAPFQAVSYPVEQKSLRLTSQVLHLPSPEDVSQGNELVYEFGSKQIRFESRSTLKRSPASLRAQKSDRWELVRIEKLEDSGGSLEFELFSNDENSVSSSFVELSDGESIFVATFLNSKRIEIKLRVKIRHTKT